MELKEIQTFAHKEHERLKKYCNFEDSTKLNLPVMIKIMEELGELCNDVLAHQGLQRKDKLDLMEIDNISEEFADIISRSYYLYSCPQY